LRLNVARKPLDGKGVTFARSEATGRMTPIFP
jgi:hypothetical protein